MDDTILYIIIAAIVALFGFGIVFFIQALTAGEKKKLQQRLSGDSRAETFNEATPARSIVVHMEGSGLPPALANIKFFQSLQRRVHMASPGLPLAKFLGVTLCASFTLFAIGFLVTDTFLVGFTGMAVGAYAPLFIINSKRNKRQKLLAEQLPEALDFLSRILRAGHSLTTGLQMMGEELPKPIGEEFKICYGQHSLGQPLEDCLKDMANRIESTDFAFFITAVLIQRQTGGDLSEVLTNIGSMIRQRIRLQQHVKAKTAEGRFTGYILVAFPAVMFMIAWTMNPAYAGVLLHTTTGLQLLGTAFGLQMLGLWAIRKITTVKV